MNNEKRVVGSKLGELIDELEEKIEKVKEEGFLTLAGKFCEDLAELFVQDKKIAKAKIALMNAETHYRKVLDLNKKSGAPLAEERLREVEKKLKILE